MSADGWIEKARYDDLVRERDEYHKVIETIPRCLEHGFCVPEALEWIEVAKAAVLAEDDIVAELTATQEAFGTLTDLRRECEVLQIERNILRAEVRRLLETIDWFDEKSECT